eukprot:1115582-Amphidinium_carterae.1
MSWARNLISRPAPAALSLLRSYAHLLRMREIVWWQVLAVQQLHRDASMRNPLAPVLLLLSQCGL